MDREFKEGDVLTLRVGVYNGVHGPAWALGPNTTKYALPGNPVFQKAGLDYEEGFKAALISHESPLRVGDRVVVKSARPHGGYLARPATIMAELPGEPDIFMIQYDRYKNYWYRKHRSDLSKDTSQ